MASEAFVNGRGRLAAIALAALAGWPVGARADGGLGAVPELALETLAEISGLDAETLAVAALTDEQGSGIRAGLGEFMKEHRPWLSTYRVIWLETVERLANIRASAAENTFDPCEFVTDEAVAKAEAEVRKARLRFEDHCRKASDGFESLLGKEAWALVRNARANRGVPAPYRWLALDEACRKQIHRLQRVYQARTKLAQDHPRLKAKLSTQWLPGRIDELLGPQQRADAARLRSRMRAVGPDTRPARDAA